MPATPSSWIASSISSTVFLVCCSGAMVSASELSSPTSSIAPTNVLVAEVNRQQLSPDLKAVLAGKTISGVVTSKTPSPIRLSTPSLWWIRDQLANLQQFGNKFIQEWIAYPLQSGQPGRVDLLVNRQQWSLLDYFQRYQFVSKFSAIARSFGYNTRVYDNPDRIPIAIYTCDFSPTAVRLLQSSPSQIAPSLTNRGVAIRDDLDSQLNCSLKMTGMANQRGL